MPADGRWWAGDEWQGGLRALLRERPTPMTHDHERLCPAASMWVALRGWVAALRDRPTPAFQFACQPGVHAVAVALALSWLEHPLGAVSAKPSGVNWYYDRHGGPLASGERPVLVGGAVSADAPWVWAPWRQRVAELAKQLAGRQRIALWAPADLSGMAPVIAAMSVAEEVLWLSPEQTVSDEAWERAAPQAAVGAPPSPPEAVWAGVEQVTLREPTLPTQGR